MRPGPKPVSPKAATYLGLPFGFVLGGGFFLLMVGLYFDPEGLLHPSWGLVIFLIASGTAFGGLAGTLLWLAGTRWTRAVLAASGAHIVAPFVFVALIFAPRSVLPVPFAGYLLTAVLGSLGLLGLLRWQSLLMPVVVIGVAVIVVLLLPPFGARMFAGFHAVLAMIAWAAGANAAARVLRDRATRPPLDV